MLVGACGAQAQQFLDYPRRNTIANKNYH